MDKKMYSYEYPRPAVTVDAMVFSNINDEISILLIQRKNNPFKDFWAFPGGFVDMNESCESAVERELEEETGVKGLSFELECVASAPHRDPRGRTLSVVYYCMIEGSQPIATGNDDAAQAEWFKLDELPQLAFDHREILEQTLQKRQLLIPSKL